MSILGAINLGVAGLTDDIGLTTDRAARVAADQNAAEYKAAHGVALDDASYARTLASQTQELPAEEEALPGEIATTAGADAQAVGEAANKVVQGAAKAAGEAEQSLLGPLIVPALIVVAGLALFYLGPGIGAWLKKKSS